MFWVMCLHSNPSHFVEAIQRASEEAEANDEPSVHPEHIEAIMAQLLLDFWGDVPMGAQLLVNVIVPRY